MLNTLEASASTALIVLAAACGVLILISIALALQLRRASRETAGRGDGDLRRELAEIGRRLATLEKGMAQVVDLVPRSVQGVGVVRYNPFPQMGGNMSFSLALLDGKADGVVISVLNNRDGSRVYGKAIQAGQSTYALSAEEQQALALARERHRQPPPASGAR